MADNEFTSAIGADGIHNNGGTGAAGALSSGTYTPTLGSSANVAASTAKEHSWKRVGQVVSVQGYWLVTPTAGSTWTYILFNIPAASNFANEWECTGGGSANVSTTSILPAVISANAAGDTVSIGFMPASTAEHKLRYSFQYQVI